VAGICGSADLREPGVASVRYRRRLLDAIATLVSAGVSTPAIFRNSRGTARRGGRTPERHQFTVMFCNLVGSTSPSARLNPEEVREVIAAYHRAVGRVVSGFDGFVSRHMGDGELWAPDQNASPLPITDDTVRGFREFQSLRFG
jgi:class 3 adenylate cyclase